MSDTSLVRIMERVQIVGLCRSDQARGVVGVEGVLFAVSESGEDAIRKDIVRLRIGDCSAIASSLEDLVAWPVRFGSQGF